MNSFNKYTVFRTVHSIYEHNDNIIPCIVAFTPCNDMTMTPNLAEYELQDIFDTFDYLLRILMIILLIIQNVPLIIKKTLKIILSVLFLNCLMIANLVIAPVAILNILSVNSTRKLVLMTMIGTAF